MKNSFIACFLLSSIAILSFNINSAYAEEDMPPTLSLSLVSEKIGDDYKMMGYVDDAGNRWGSILFKDANGSLIGHATFLNNQQHGPYVEHIPNSPARLLVLINYVDGERNGPYIYWYESGAPSFMGQMKNGRADGNWIRYWENGVLMSSGVYVDGKLISAYARRTTTSELERVVDEGNGTLVIFDLNGELLSREVYENGELVERGGGIVDTLPPEDDSEP